jgi:hypothetical protein
MELHVARKTRALASAIALCDSADRLHSRRHKTHGAAV